MSDHDGLELVITIVWNAQLALQVQEMLRKDPLSGHLFVFRGLRSDLVKVIWHDGQGACLFTKRLERGRFIWPSVAGESVTISPAQMSYLFRESIGTTLKKPSVRRGSDSPFGLESAA